MARSHPPTLLTLTARTLREECRMSPGERILVAVSGGPDSSALLHVLAMLRDRLGFRLHAHGVDHGLREEASLELDLAATLSRRFDVPFTRSVLSIRDGGNLQARARKARYDALRRAAGEHACSRIATAHHADDRAETVLLRLLRGAGPRGLAVLPAVDGDKLRPLIRARREDVLRHIERHAIQTATDPSNENRRFQRIRVRKDLLPLLQELSPGIVGHLTALADAMGTETPPVLTDATGRLVVLKRAHVTEIRRALQRGHREAAVQLPRGRVVRVEPSTGGVHIENTGRLMSSSRRRGGRTAESEGPRPDPLETRTSRGAKPRKSG